MCGPGSPLPDLEPFRRPPVSIQMLDISRLPVPPRHASLPCTDEPELWFADSPDELELAKQRCRQCPIQRACLDGAIDRAEPWGVWGGQILINGEVVARKRPRGRPRKDASLVA
jgi:WhiB family redox-sensing transcriptional regulator